MKDENYQKQYLKGLVRGFTWKALMSNGAIFEIWTATDIKQSEARIKLLKEAEYYQSKDIERIWRCLG